MNLPEIDLAQTAANLVRGSDGIWTARSRQDISYPDEGNLNCLALEADSFWFLHRSRCILAVMRRYAPPGMLFDIGGGNGYVASDLQKSGLPVALVEPGRTGVMHARERGVETLVWSSLEDAGFFRNVLPAVGLFDVLEHIQDDRSFLVAINDLLQPGGRVYLTVPAYPGLWSADDDYAGHHRRYSLRSLRQSLESAGFTAVFTSYFFFMLPVPIFLMRTIPSRLGLRKQAAWANYQREHKQQSGLTRGLMDRLLAWELGRLQNGKLMPFGGSLLAVAEKRRSG